MSVYLDASVLVSFFTADALSDSADRFLRSGVGEVVVSDFAAAEFASAVSRLVRMKRLKPDDAREVLEDFDTWVERAAAMAEIASEDIAAAARYLRRLDLTLRTPDAVNIAIAHRISATLATFDAPMADSARALGVAVAVI